LLTLGRAVIRCPRPGRGDPVPLRPEIMEELVCEPGPIEGAGMAVEEFDPALPLPRGEFLQGLEIGVARVFPIDHELPQFTADPEGGEAEPAVIGVGEEEEEWAHRVVSAYLPGEPGALPGRIALGQFEEEGKESVPFARDHQRPDPGLAGQAICRICRRWDGSERGLETERAEQGPERSAAGSPPEQSIEMMRSRSHDREESAPGGAEP